MKYGLINPNNNRILDVADREFPVARPLFWTTVADDVDPRTHRYSDGAVVPVTPTPEDPLPVLVSPHAKIDDLARALIDKGVLREQDLPERSRPGPPGRGGGRP